MTFSSTAVLPSSSAPCSSALVVYYGNIFAGLWYPVGIALATAAVALIVLPETKDRSID
jgi:hypothetical protein